MATNVQPGRDERGRRARSPWSMPWSGWKDVLSRTAKEASEDNIGLVAAGVAFYAFLALVPLLAAIVLAYGFAADPRSVVKTMGSLTRVLPADAAKLIGDQLLAVVRTSGEKKGLGILAALAVAIFGARNAAGALIIALNIAYEEKEKRGFVAVTLLALAMTVAAVVAALTAIAAFSALALLAALLPSASPLVIWGTRIFSYLLLLAGASFGAAVLYRYGPSRAEPRWAWITPGSASCAVGWLLLSVGFGIYVARFGGYGKTYGSLAAVVVLLTWIYLSAYVFLFGAELNSEFERQAAAASPVASRPPDAVATGAADPPAPSANPSPPVGHAGGQGGTEQAWAAGGGDHPYLAARLTARAAPLAGMPRVGIAASVLATGGLSLLRRRGRARAGALLLGAAALLSLLRRDSSHDA